VHHAVRALWVANLRQQRALAAQVVVSVADKRAGALGIAEA
jgi:hypothetical protein